MNKPEETPRGSSANPNPGKTPAAASLLPVGSTFVALGIRYRVRKRTKKDLVIRPIGRQVPADVLPGNAHASGAEEGANDDD